MSRLGLVQTLVVVALVALATNCPVYSQVVTDEELSDYLGQINADLAASNADYCIGMVELLVHPAGGGQGRTIIARNLGNKRINAQFVSGDPRRGERKNITYLVDISAGATSGLDGFQTEAAIDRAMTTWDQASRSSIPILKVADPGGNYEAFDSFLANLSMKLQKCSESDFPDGIPLFGYPDLDHDGTIDVDIIFGGWLPGCAFSIIQGGDYILGITITWLWLGPEGLTDIDNNGRADVSRREIFFNNHFQWKINGAPDSIDVETVALHEAGHGLSIGHIGTTFLTKDRRLEMKPVSVMNEFYMGKLQQLTGVDKAVFNSIWRNWSAGNNPDTQSRTLRRR